MTYELAKQLKDAGFPQTGTHTKFFSGLDKLPVSVGFGYEPLAVEDSIYVPTLKELIEACGEKFGSLNNNGSFWQANHSTKSIEGIGSTPEEAVANLWIELHK